MTINELSKLIEGGALEKYSELYSNTASAKERFSAAITSFSKLYGDSREVAVFSVPGRSEISGNHTDHNCGKVLCGAIDKDVIAIASKNDDGVIRIHSEGYPEDTVTVSEVGDPDSYKKYSSAALIAGTAKAFVDRGYSVGGFDAYLTSEVLRGSGISSSAAYEVMIGNMISHLYNGGAVDAVELAKIAKYAENEYFGKPCGLMDQTACAVGGFVYIDFADPNSPEILPIDFSLTSYGWSLCIVNTGGNHADLNEDYASVPSEMRQVAKLLGRDVLRGLSEEDIIKNLRNIRRIVGDRAVLRTLHFLRENDRVEAIKESLINSDLQGFLSGLRESGRSSFEFLQNVYSNQNVKEQGLSLALALAEGYLSGKEFVARVHGGGFAGTIQVFLKNEDAEDFTEYMDQVFGEGSAEVFRIRPKGAVKLF